ncbi:MAG: hypothetical protein BAA04_06525 [Firmicutes bacterium ZCTH02-B6]|nr:MAG: hypothetical protein BAA04_06525 [Firmicutes bacterium ZCTH02-B6]
MLAGPEPARVRGSGQLIKKLNRSRILECLQQSGPLSRVELAQRTGISLPSVSHLMHEMQEEGLVVPVGQGPSRGGRRPMLFAYNSRLAYVVGLDVGGTKVAGGVSDLDGNLLATATIPTHSETGSTDDVPARILQLVHRLLDQAGIDVSKVMGIGIGVPGIPDPEGRTVTLAPGLRRDESRVLVVEGAAALNGDRRAGRYGHDGGAWYGDDGSGRGGDDGRSYCGGESRATSGDDADDPCGEDRNARSGDVSGAAGAIPIGQYLQEHLGRPVYMDNDVNAMLRGEVWRGALQGERHAVGVTVGTGIGVGLLVNGEVYTGARGSAGEIGYWLIGALGPITRSAGYGPLETFAAGPGIARRYVARLKARGYGSVVLDLAGGDVSKISARLVAEGAVLGDPLALDVWRETAEMLGVALANLCCLMDPEVLVLGGGVSRAPRELFLDPVQRIIETLVPYPPRVVPSHLGEQAVILGAVATVLDSRRSSISYVTAGVES